MKPMKFMTAGLGMAAALMASACRDKSQEPNVVNLTAALNAHYADKRECFDIGDAPHGRGVIKAFRTDGKGFGSETRGLYEALAQEGILARVPFQRQEQNFSQKEQVDYTGYTISAQGQPYVQTVSQTPDALGTGAPRLCYGAREVVDILNFTRPADTQGVRALQVTYRYKLVDIPAWARSPVLAQHMDWLPKRIAAAPIEAKDDLVLTDTGWVHHSRLKN